MATECLAELTGKIYSMFPLGGVPWSTLKSSVAWDVR
jgi:hypothetical protein